MWMFTVLVITCTKVSKGALLDPANVVSPRLTVEPTDVIFDPNGVANSVSFQCSANGDPTPKYLWIKEYDDLDSITRQPPYQITGGTLTIPVPTPADAGRYWCQAYNEYGRVVSIGANLTFAYVDDFDTAARTGVTTTGGNGTRLECKPPGAYPGLLFHWIEAGQTSFVADDLRNYASRKNGDIYFANVSPQDTGLYQCGVKINLKGSNDPAGFSEFSPHTELTVNPVNNVPLQAPQFVLFENIRYQKKGDDVLMEFFAYGNPSPTLGWRRLDAVGGSPVEFPASVVYELFNRNMKLTKVAVADQGFYEVTATNSEGTDVKTAQLIIEDVPQYVKRLETQNLDQEPGQDINLEVTWKDDGRNPVTPTWYYNGRDIVPSSKYIINNSPTASSLTVTNAQPVDGGSYQSILSNRYGLVPSFSEVRVGAPGKVSDLQLVEKGDNSAKLSWTEPPSKGAELAGYQIQYYPTGDPNNIQYMDVGKDPTQATVLNSNPDISTYRVRAKTTDGLYGPYSDPLVNGKVVPVATNTDSPRQAGRAGGVPLVAWLLPVLLLLLPLLLLLLFCCCCKGWCGGKKEEKVKLEEGQMVSASLTPMSREHQDMLKTYRTTIVDNMKTPGRVTARMAQEKVIPASMAEAIASHPVRQDKSKKLLDTMVLGGDKSFDSFCGGLRKDEKLDWLADTLEGSGLSMGNRTRLETHKQLLASKMDPESTLTYLVQNQIFSEDMAKYCFDADSAEEKNKRILHLMQSRSDEDFSIFCSGLRANEKQAYIADLLQGEGVDLNKDVLDQEERMNMTLDKSSAPFGMGAAGAGLGAAGAGLGAAGAGLGAATAGLAGAQLGTDKVGLNSTGPGLKSASAFGTSMGDTGAHGLQMNSTYSGHNFNGAVVKGLEEKYLIDATAPPGSLMSASSTMVPTGQPVILEVRGEVDNVQWLYNGESVHGDPGITTTSDGTLHELNIDRMSPDRDGTYTCRGDTPDGGKVSCDIKVQTLV